MPIPVEGKRNEWIVSKAEQEQIKTDKDAGVVQVMYRGTSAQSITGLGTFEPGVTQKLTREQAQIIIAIGDPAFEVNGAPVAPAHKPDFDVPLPQPKPEDMPKPLTAEDVLKGIEKKQAEAAQTPQASVVGGDVKGGKK